MIIFSANVDLVPKESTLDIAELKAYTDLLNLHHMLTPLFQITKVLNAGQIEEKDLTNAYK